MALEKTVIQMNTASVVTGTLNCPPQDVSAALGLIFSWRCEATSTYGSGSGSVKMRVYTSPDNVNWDTVPYIQYSYTLNEPKIKQKSVRVGPEIKYCKMQLLPTHSASIIADTWITVVG